MYSVCEAGRQYQSAIRDTSSFHPTYICVKDVQQRGSFQWTVKISHLAGTTTGAGAVKFTILGEVRAPILHSLGIIGCGVTQVVFE